MTYNITARTIERTSAAGCAQTSPVSPSAAFRINRAGMNTIPCLLKFMIREAAAAPISSAVIDVSAKTSSSVYKSEYTGTKPYRAVTTNLNQTSIETRAETVFYKNKLGMTGKNSAGEIPYRQTGGVANGQIEAATSADKYSFENIQSGNKPVKNVEWSDFDDNVVIAPSAETFQFDSEQSGNNPRRSTEFSNAESNIHTQAEADNFSFSVDMTGESSAGEIPRTDIQFSVEKGGVIPTVTAESFAYKTKRCGTERCKD